MAKLSKAIEKDVYKKERIKEQLTRVEYLAYEGVDGFNEWEEEFVESIEARLRKGYELSEAENECLEKLEAK